MVQLLFREREQRTWAEGGQVDQRAVTNAEAPMSEREGTYRDTPSAFPNDDI